MSAPKWQLLEGNWRDVLPRSIRGHIITDPPYDDLPEVQELRTRCPKGNLLMFSRPGMEPRDANEYLFWIKTPSTKNYKRRCGRFVEMISVFRGEDTPFSVLHWSQMTGVYDDRLIRPPKHPFEKPLTLIERLLRLYTKKGDLVCDPYAGSGTVGVAALRLGRRFIGAEADPEFFRLAQARIKKAG